MPPVQPRVGSQQPAHEVEQAAASSLGAVPPSSPSEAPLLPLSLALPLDVPLPVGVLVAGVPLVLLPLGEAPEDPEPASTKARATTPAS